MEFETRNAACYERGPGARSCINSPVRRRVDTCNTLSASCARQKDSGRRLCVRLRSFKNRFTAQHMCCVLSFRTKITMPRMTCDLGSLVSAYFEKIPTRVLWRECCAENLNVENIMRGEKSRKPGMKIDED